MIHTTHGGTVSETARGLYVRDVLLCAPPPPPPPNAANMQPKDPNGQPLPLADTAPCSGCHRLMDKIGMGLSEYDSIGRHRPASPPAQGTFFDRNDTANLFSGSGELADIVAKQPEVGRCMAQRALQWLLGRSLVASDSCTVARAWHRFLSSNRRLDDLWVELVRSDAFRYRRGGTP